MNWIRPAAIGAGAAAVGIGLATQTFTFAKEHTANVGEKYWDRQLDGTDRSSPEYYGGSSIMIAIGALAAGTLGATMLTRTASLGASALDGAALAAGVATLGYAIGGFPGFAAGKERSIEKHGADIEAQADRLLRNFDRNNDGGLSTTEDSYPEYLYKYEMDIHRKGYEPQTKYASIEKFVHAADADGDFNATRAEIVDKLTSFDANGNGKLSSNDVERMRDAGLETVAAQSMIVDYDPWGASIVTEW
jgi:hypothetical protein